MLLSRIGRKTGQVATEYGLVLSVLTIAVVAGAFVFVPGFRDGTSSLANDISTILDTQQIANMGSGAGGGGVGRSGNGDPNGQGNAGNGGNSGQPSGVPNNETEESTTVTIGGDRGLEAPGFGGNTTSVTGTSITDVASGNAATREFIPPLGQPAGGISQSSAEWLVNAAKEAGITDPQICSQYALWLHAPGTLQDITEATVEQDLTRTGQLQIPRFSFFGMDFGGTTVEVTQGQMNLRGMQQYLSSKGQESNLIRNGTIDQLDQLVEDGHSPVVIIDAQNGAADCDGFCGHTVTVLGVRNEGGVRTVVVKDAFGQYSIPAEQFDRAWAQHGRKALDIPKRPYFYTSVENDIP